MTNHWQVIEDALEDALQGAGYCGEDEEAERFGAALAFVRAQLAECGEWEPVSEGTIEFAAGGDSMGIARPKALVLGGSNKGTLIMSTLSMAGESRFGHTVRWGKDWRIQRRVQREDENE